MTDWLSQALLIGMSVAAFTHLLRVVPPGKQLYKKQLKPVACDLCMSFWGVLATGAALFLSGTGNQSLIDWGRPLLPAFIISLWLLKQTTVFDIPLLESEDEDGNGKS